MSFKTFSIRQGSSKPVVVDGKAAAAADAQKAPADKSAPASAPPARD